jgi:peptidoglycan/xylan/chitin deacetylase (PgdA/CDA1 family)
MKPVDTYQELVKYKPRTARQLGRRRVLDAVSLGYSLLHPMEALFRKPRIQFLYIHHIFKDEEERLSKLLQALARHHTFIGYSEAVNRILQGRIDKPYICLSSDDGLKNNLRAAAIMKGYGANACFFICPSIIGEKDPQKISDFSGGRLHFPPVEFMDWNDVDTLLQQGHEIGGHSLSHINMAQVPEETLKKEVGDCFRILEGKCGGNLHFAWPYGRFSDFSRHARELVFRVGYASCASAIRGCHITMTGTTLPVPGLLIRRDHIVLDWPLRHILFFIARNAEQANPANNFYPETCA